MALSPSQTADLYLWLVSELPKATHPGASPSVLADYILVVHGTYLGRGESSRPKLVETLEKFCDEPAVFVDKFLVRVSRPNPLPSRSTDPFPALPNPYRILFLHLEPLSLWTPFLLALIFPAWFMGELIPPSAAFPAAAEIGAREKMAIWQLGNCYGLLGLISAFVFRAVRDTLRDEPEKQERIVAASFTALAIADVTHIALTLIALPPSLRLSPLQWNPMTIGNIPTVVVLFLGRMCWFAGVGRMRVGKTKSA